MIGLGRQYKMVDVVKALGYVVIGVFVVIGIAMIYTVPVYFLWNWLMPIIFELPRITFWQSLGLSLLAGFLFGRSSYSNGD